MERIMGLRDDAARRRSRRRGVVVVELPRRARRRVVEQVCHRNRRRRVGLAGSSEGDQTSDWIVSSSEITERVVGRVGVKGLRGLESPSPVLSRPSPLSYAPWL